MRIRAARREHLAWLVRRTDCHFSPVAKGVEAVDDSGRILGMVVFDAWTENAAQAHMAVDAPIAWRGLLPFALGYLFLEAKKGVLLGAISSQNTRSLRFARHVGLVELTRIKDGAAEGDDLVLLELRKENCRYLHGQRKAA